MKLVELIHRVGRRARTGDFTQLDMAEKGDVLQAANVALQKVYNALPIYFKQMTVGFYLSAPATVSCQVTAGSTALGNSPFTTAQIGNTVIIDGDGAWNQVVAVNELQNPYNGTTGTQSATVYSDSVYSSRYPLDRVVGNPMFADQTQGALMSRDMMNANSPYSGLCPTFGKPGTWWVQPFGGSQGRSPLLFVRFLPLPSSAYAIKIPIAYWPMRLTLDDYQSNAEIAVPDQFLDACLIPLGIRALMDTPAFLSRGDEQTLKESAIEGDQFLRLQPGQMSPSNRVLTPTGF